MNASKIHLAGRFPIRDRQPLTVRVGQYFLAVFAIAITIIALVALRDILGLSIVALLFFLPVGLSAAFGGLGPGILSAVLGFLCLNYYFIPPYYSLSVHHTRDLLALVIFLGVAVVINYLVNRSRVSLAQATAREHETTWLYELSSSLAGLNDEKAIARALAEKILQTFSAACAQVNLEASTERASFSFCLPEQPDPQEPEPDLIAPLQTARGLIGEICVWRPGSPFVPVEERLLQTFANQGALALERARLARTETRARILEESNKLKSVLLSSVSHELRTPLATIKASVSSLLSKEMTWDEESRRELLETVEEETDHLNQLVGNLLDMTRIESGALTPQFRWNMLHEVVSNVAKRMRKEAGNRKILNQVPDDLPLVPLDYVQMERVFSNLISNSIKYSPENSTITICAEKLGEGALQVEVKNQGPHVAEEHLGHIFDKFYRITAADTITGTGLGLSICKGFVEAHGGRIWAENLPDGFAFRFTLPLAREGALLRMPEEL